MNLAHLAVLISALLPYAFVGYAKSTARFLKGGGNNDPRAYAATIDGPRKRAYNAHLNGFEAFPAFAAGVAQATVDQLAVVFVVARVLHGVLYILDQATLRSIVWTIGVAAVVGLMVLSL